MERVFLKIVNMSLSASVVILAVILARFLLQRAPKKWSYLLWSVVAFRLCCPVSLESVFSIFRAAPVRPAVTSVTAAGGANTIQYIPQNIGMMAQPQINIGTPAVSGAVSSSLPAAEPIYSANPLQVWIFLGAMVWAVGMAVLFLYTVISYLDMRQKVSTAVCLEGNVWQSDEVGSPFILGFVGSKIYIPYGLEGERLQYVLEHERYHIKRRDHIIKALAFVLLAVHWFNPLCWLAFRLMGEDMEMSCDEKVLDDNGNIRKAYSTALLSFATGGRFPAASPLAFGETAVKTRIKNALKWKKPKTWATALAAVLCLALVVSCAVNPAGERAAPQPSNPDQEVKTTGQYESMEDYINQIMADIKTVTYYAYPGEGEVRGTDEDSERTANVTAVKLAYLEQHRGEVAGLAPEGVLESWKYNILVQIDADAATVALVGGMYEEDGWFDLEGQGGHVTMALRYPDGTYDVLYDQVVNDGGDFYGYHSTAEEAIYDKYVELMGLDLPRYVIERDMEKPAEAGGGYWYHTGFRRYDGDGWYIYIPIQTWSLGRESDGWTDWISAYSPDAYLVVQYVTGPTERPDLNEYQTDTFYGKGDGTGWYVYTTYDPAQHTWDEFSNKASAPGEMKLMAESFTVDERFDKSADTAAGPAGEGAPFTNVMGLAGYIVTEQESIGRYRREYFVPKEAGGGRYIIAESYSYDPMDYAVDLDGDGVTELICNNKAAVEDERENVHVFRQGEGGIDLWYPDTDKLRKRLTDWDPDQINSLRERYDPEKGVFAVTYPSLGTASGVNTVELTGLEDFTFSFYSEYPGTWVTPTAIGLLGAALGQLADVNRPKDFKGNIALGIADGPNLHYTGYDPDTWNGKGYAYGIVNEFTYTYAPDAAYPGGDRVQLTFLDGKTMKFFADEPDLIRYDKYFYRAAHSGEPSVFAPDPYTLARSWVDEAEYRADQETFEKTGTPYRGDDHMEAARDYAALYENLHMGVSWGSSFKYTYVQTFVEDEPDATEAHRRYDGAGENTWAFSTTTIFVPENKRARDMSVAGNTRKIAGDPELEARYPDAPEGACVYWRCGYITHNPDGSWTGSIAGTGW